MSLDNRIGNSSNHLDTTVSTRASSAQTKVMDAAVEPPQPKILTFASPMSVGESEQLKIGGFLERCNYCKKRIGHDSEVFMYSDLCAFCSAECRDLQIAVDKSAEKEQKIPNKKVVHASGFTT